MTHSKPIIVTRNLNVTYFPGQSNEVRALADINIDVEPGEFIIFFGPSGCGKSTLLYAISGLEHRARGKIIISGKDLVTMTGREREVFHQKTIGMIFQAYYLISSLSVIQNVMLPRMAIDGSARERAARAQKILTHFGIGPQAKKLPDELSGGQRQRVAICRSVMNEPEILLADEPVGNLDTKAAQDVLDLLRELNAEHKKTIILVTHNPAHLHYAHRIFYMRDGKIVAVKRNTEAERRRSVIESVQEKGMPSGLKHWLLTFQNKNLSQEKEAMLARAQAMLAEKLTGFTIGEIGAVEQKVVQSILNRHVHPAAFRDLFHGEIDAGGLGIDRHRSAHLADEVTRIVREVLCLSRLQKRTKKARRNGVHAQAREMRRYVCKRMKLSVRSRHVARVIDDAIAARILGVIDRTHFQQRLHLPSAKGGAGMEKRIAQLFGRHLGPLVLGDFQKEKEEKETKKVPVSAPAAAGAPADEKKGEGEQKRKLLPMRRRKRSAVARAVLPFLRRWKKRFF